VPSFPASRDEREFLGLERLNEPIQVHELEPLMETNAGAFENVLSMTYAQYKCYSYY
jgi:hypothetical protein